MKEHTTRRTSPKRFILTALCVIATLAVLITAGIVTTVAIVENNSVGIGVAIENSIADAGFTEDMITVTRARLSLDDGVFVYDVKFIAVGNEYDYTVRASDGVVLDTEIELVRLGAVTTTSVDTTGWISLDAAKEIAVADAGVNPADVTFTMAEAERENGSYVYDMDFRVGLTEYDYEIDVLTGAIVDKDIDLNNPGKDDDDDDAATIDASVDTSAFITLDAAKAAALVNAGVPHESATFTEERLDHDNGKYKYEIEFVADNVEYDYELDPETGAVLSVSKQKIKTDTVITADPQVIETVRIPSSNDNPPSPESEYIGVDMAREIAMSHAGCPESRTGFHKTMLDRDDGIYVYELEFVCDAYWYEYELDAKTGAVLEAEKSINTFDKAFGTRTFSASRSGSGSITEAEIDD